MTCPCNSLPCVCPKETVNVRHFCANCDCDEDEHSEGPCALCGTCQEFAETAYVPPEPGPPPTTGLASAESPPRESGNGHVLPPSPAPQAGTQKGELEADHAAGDELAIGGDVDDVHANPIDGYPPTRKRKSSYSAAASPLRPARETVHAAFRQLAEARGMTNLPRCILRSDAADDCVPACVAMTDMLLADRAARPEVAEVERLRAAMALLREWTNDQLAAGRMDCYGDCRNECLDDDGNFITDRTKACWKHRRFWLLAADRRGEP